MKFCLNNNFLFACENTSCHLKCRIETVMSRKFEIFGVAQKIGLVVPILFWFTNASCIERSTKSNPKA